MTTSGRLRVVVPREIRKAILEQAAASRNETGGALIGWRLTVPGAPGALLVVRTHLPAGPSAPSGPTHLSQGGTQQAQLMALLARREAWPHGTQAPRWLGDWHSHPGGPREPSGGDRRTAASLLDDDPSLTELLVGIASPVQGRWRLAFRAVERSPGGLRWHVPVLLGPERASVGEDLESLGPAPTPRSLVHWWLTEGRLAHARTS